MNKLFKKLYKFWDLEFKEPTKKTFEFKNNNSLIFEIENFLSQPFEKTHMNNEHLVTSGTLFDFSVNDILVDDIKTENKPKSKKDNLIESLTYLKSKTTKTKQDHESIYTLEMVLKNMS